MTANGKYYLCFSVLFMLSLNKSYKNSIHCKYKYFDSTVQRAEDRRQKVYFCRLPFAVNVKLNLSIAACTLTHFIDLLVFVDLICLTTVINWRGHLSIAVKMLSPLLSSFLM